MSWESTTKTLAEAGTRTSAGRPRSLPAGLARSVLEKLAEPLVVLGTDLRPIWSNRNLGDPAAPPCLGCDPTGDPLCRDCGARAALETGRDHQDAGANRPLHHQPLISDQGEVEAVLVRVSRRQDTAPSVADLEARLKQAGEENEQLVRAIAHAQSMTMETEAAHESMAHFLANMSHEIRTPMNGVLGMTEILLGTDLSAEQRDYLETAYNSAESLLGIINDILDFSKIEAGKLELEEIPFDLGGTLEEVGDLLAFKAHDKGLEFLVTVAPDLPAQVLGDPTRLRQAVTNLAGNAIKFTDKGEVEISVGLDGGDDTAGLFRVEVRDTGIGIPEQARKRLFEPFTQAEGSTTRQFGGTGLGLSICRKLAEMMGGEVGVDSAPGEGSTFHFTCVLNLPAADADPAGCALVPPAGLAGRSFRLLLKNESLRRHLDGLLQSWGARPLDDHTPASGQLILFDEHHAPEAARLSGEGIEGRHLVLLERLGEQQELPEGLGARLAGRLNRPLKIRVLADLLQRVVSRQPDQAPSRTDRRPLIGDLPELGHLRVLIAEDNLVNQKVARSFLKKVGITDQTMVENGAVALEALAAEDFDLVLMDIQMPVMDGTEAMRRIRAGSDQVRRPDIPIIALTANALVGHREEYLRAGADGYLSKPLKAEALVKALVELGLASS